MSKGGSLDSQNETSESSGHDDSSSDTDCDWNRGGVGPVGAGPSRAMPAIRPNASRNRHRQLEVLKKYEAKYKLMARNELERKMLPHVSSTFVKYQSVMYIHRLDLSQVVSDLKVTWKPLCDTYIGQAAEETQFYSLIAGRGELIMFGGILHEFKNSSSLGRCNRISREVHIVSFPLDKIK